jgi:hypothetical protein
MTDDTTLDQQPSSGQPENWELRFKGQVPVIERLTKANRDKDAQLVNIASELEQLKVQLNTSAIEKDAAVGERDKKLTELIQAKSQAESEIKRLRALEMKVKVAKEIGRPDLLELVEVIPNVEDEEALKTIMKTFEEFADKRVKETEKRILSGVTPTTSPVVQPPSTPTSLEGWQKYVNEVPYGSPEKQKRMSQWKAWGEASEN